MNKLNKIMEKYNIKGREMSNLLGVSENYIYISKKKDVLTKQILTSLNLFEENQNLKEENKNLKQENKILIRMMNEQER